MSSAKCCSFRLGLNVLMTVITAYITGNPAAVKYDLPVRNAIYQRIYERPLISMNRYTIYEWHLVNVFQLTCKCICDFTFMLPVSLLAATVLTYTQGTRTISYILPRKLLRGNWKYVILIFFCSFFLCRTHWLLVIPLVWLFVCPCIYLHPPTRSQYLLIPICLCMRSCVRLSAFMLAWLFVCACVNQPVCPYGYLYSPISI